MDITFYGAAKEVTGSKHLLHLKGKNILFDCGMFQGDVDQDIIFEKNKELPFNPSKIDAIILSHAHLDHCGSLPTAYKNGFRGKIFSTPATKRLAELIMLDSANIQQANARSEFGRRGEVIYSQEDVYKTLSLFQTVEYYQRFKIFDGIEAKFKDAGHILGSVIVEIFTDGDDKPIIGFSGDLGRKNMPILRDFDYFDDGLKYLVVESTYGGKIHETLDEATSALKKAISEAKKNKSKVIIPAFSLGRTQLIVYLLNQLTKNGEIPKIPIYVDSPLSLKITAVFKEFKKYYDEKSLSLIKASRKLFSFSNLKYIPNSKKSKRLNNKSGPMVIISSSGMCEGGRIIHHLAHSIGDGRNFIIITGFMAEGTLGRKIEEGEKEVYIFGKKYNVKAKVISLHSLSAHGDQNDLVDFISKISNNLEHIFIVHGEPDQSSALVEKIRQFNKVVKIDIPDFGQNFKLL